MNGFKRCKVLNLEQVLILNRAELFKRNRIDFIMRTKILDSFAFFYKIT